MELIPEIRIAGPVVIKFSPNFLNFILGNEKFQGTRNFKFYFKIVLFILFKYYIIKILYLY